jgi:hypothetical protein
MRQASWVAHSEGESSTEAHLWHTTPPQVLRKISPIGVWKQSEQSYHSIFLRQGTAHGARQKASLPLAKIPRKSDMDKHFSKKRTFRLKTSAEWKTAIYFYDYPLFYVAFQKKR